MEQQESGTYYVSVKKKNKPVEQEPRETNGGARVDAMINCFDSVRADRHDHDILPARCEQFKRTGIPGVGRTD
jgi:hypothetical protein